VDTSAGLNSKEKRKTLAPPGGFEHQQFSPLPVTIPTPAMIITQIIPGVLLYI
jgi:hypothetical protein